MSEREAYVSEPEAQDLQEAELQGDTSESWPESLADEFAPYADDDTSQPEAAGASTQTVRKRYASPVLLGVLFFAATLVAGVGMGFGVLTALGGRPEELWRFDGFMAIDRIVQFDLYPANLFWILATATVILGLLVADAVARAVTGIRKDTIRTQALLATITGLDPNDGQAWTDPRLAEDPAAKSFADRTHQAHQALQEKLKRYIGMEGEVKRLERALVDNARVDLAATYEIPSVGALADEVLRTFDDRIHAVQEKEQFVEKTCDGGTEQIGIVQDACSWHAATLDQVSLQGAAMERLKVKTATLFDTAQQVRQARDGFDLGERLSALRDELTASQAANQKKTRPEIVPALSDLADRASKLAFQIAMEVARLGSKGERLLPMTQDLEDLTTQFRAFSGKVKESSEGDGDVTPAVTSVADQLGQLAEGQTESAETAEFWQSLIGTAEEIPPLANHAAESLLAIAREFDTQFDRLVELGKKCSQTTGAHFDAGNLAVGNAANPPGGGMHVDQFDPFSKTAFKEEQPLLQADPFAAASTSPFDAAAVESGPLFESATDSETSPVDTTEATAPAADLLSSDSDVDTFAPATVNEPPLPQTELSTAAERIYDLAEFDAVSLGRKDSATADAEEPIYDLSEFGAVPVD